MSYKKLLYHYYIDPESSNRNYTEVLALVNELRVISKMQLIELFNMERKLSRKTIERVLNFWVDDGSLQILSDYRYNKSTVYHITHEGVGFLGSPFTVPKNPLYNLEHHLKINDMLIEGFRVIGNHPLLNSVSSERRLVYEAKDAQENAKGRIYKVPDFTFDFLDFEKEIDITWHFEIELTLKSFTRYQKRILPHYIKLLEDEYTQQDKIIYAVPTLSIQRKLEQMVGEFESGRGKRYENLVIVHFDDFSKKLIELSQDLN
ncbi:hypothetical protein ACYRFS_12795 [Listeria kieliensis]